CLLFLMAIPTTESPFTNWKEWPGEPVYELEGMAKRLGIDPEEAKRKAEELGLKPNTLKVHRVN
uniref:hypothetical protein n=1 Tax=Pseudomonas aeruginosa TaxID=287 RepID=UPI00287F9FD0